MKLKFLIWNDRRDITAKWVRTVEDEGFAVCGTSQSTDHKEFAELFASLNPDVVLLDIMAPGKNRAGLELGEVIRLTDPLVPILAVSDQPQQVYSHTELFSKVRFAGVFQSKVMEEGAFGGIALRPSLNLWHLMHPEWSLVRYCVRGLRAMFTGTAVADEANELIKILHRLPFSGAMESWHSQIAGDLKQAFVTCGLTDIGSRFQELCSLFEKADQFYMAGTESRRHVSHNVQVYLLGLAILCNCPLLSEAAVTQLPTGLGGRDAREARLFAAIMLWTCIANTHDVGYLAERMNKVLSSLRLVMDSFVSGGAFAAGLTVRRLPEVSWPEQYHGMTGSNLWQANISGAEEPFAAIIGDAIHCHDCRRSARGVQKIDKWANFLAILCDELQDWGRERREAEAGTDAYKSSPWALFTPESIDICRDELSLNANDSPVWLVRIRFIALAYPPIVTHHAGSPGVKAVQSIIDRITSQLRDGLESDGTMRVDIRIDIVSREGGKASGATPL